MQWEMRLFPFTVHHLRVVKVRKMELGLFACNVHHLGLSKSENGIGNEIVSLERPPLRGCQSQKMESDMWLFPFKSTN